ncbi:MAG: Ig-like domain-containing protein [candidate division KSB1 bacterium]|nr:Ig-like domain-containing protein [candidate division KSB1 bacterium]MDZ7301461.1 Ig-like domain-containing protein [candidate division KSB1 bacterium]MDZ7310863.1 Ig-like domain-containing protein [candidate division KSB1 bacterium]
MDKLKTGMALTMLALGLLLVNCSTKIGPDEPDPFPNLHIVRTNPENGKTGVTDSVNLSITFSAAIDTTSLGLVIAPSPPGFYSRLQLSADGKTISSSVKLAPNTVYSLVIFFVQDLYQDRITQPFITHFTTGTSLPRGQISGKAGVPFNVPLQGFAGLVRKNLQDIFNATFPDHELRQNLVAVAPIMNNAGEFQFDHVPPGTYWPFAGKDLNFDGKFSLASVDQVQAYDANNDGAPDSVVVGIDQRLAAINLNVPVVGMKVVRTTPANGATNLPLDADLQITFNVPVDTADLGLFIAPIPEGLSTKDLKPSADGKTLTARVKLLANTAYTAVLYAARSKGGQVLSAPLEISFTTGNSFPTGEVSGTATLRGAGMAAAQNALVALLNTDLQQVILEIFGGKDPTEVLRSHLRAISYVRDASGKFVISHVPAGTYWPAGAKDEDNDGSIEPLTEPIGFYDADNDGSATRADSLRILAGQKLTAINMIFQKLF